MCKPTLSRTWWGPAALGRHTVGPGPLIRGCCRVRFHALVSPLPPEGSFNDTVPSCHPRQEFQASLHRTGPPSGCCGPRGGRLGLGVQPGCLGVCRQVEEHLALLHELVQTPSRARGHNLIPAHSCSRWSDDVPPGVRTPAPRTRGSKRCPRGHVAASAAVPDPHGRGANARPVHAAVSAVPPPPAFPHRAADPPSSRPLSSLAAITGFPGGGTQACRPPAVWFLKPRPSWPLPHPRPSVS